MKDRLELLLAQRLAAVSSASLQAPSCPSSRRQLAQPHYRKDQGASGSAPSMALCFRALLRFDIGRSLTRGPRRGSAGTRQFSITNESDAPAPWLRISPQEAGGLDPKRFEAQEGALGDQQCQEPGLGCPM